MAHYQCIVIIVEQLPAVYATYIFTRRANAGAPARVKLPVR